MQSGEQEPNVAPERPRSRWDRIIWPHWLPIRARLPLIAQITGAIALIAAFTMPGFSDVSPAPVPASIPVPVETPAPLAPPVPAVAPPVERARPAHLNLDLRHSFRSVDLTVTVDNKRVLETRLEGAGKKFGMFGKRGERSFTRTLDLDPGVRVVRLRIRSESDKFDHTRVERFELGSASVAAMRIAVDKSGLDVVAERPPVPPPSADPTPAPTAAEALTTASTVAALPAGAAAPAVTSSAVAELYQTLRQVLMALAGFVASVASGFLFEEYLKSKNLSPFHSSESAPDPARAERRRRGTRRPRRESDISIDAGLS